MTQIESPKIVKKKLFSPIWLLPMVAFALSVWLGVKSYRESGIEIMIHFPSATGIDVGKTLVRYQGLTVGKVTDIAIDKELQGVDVKVTMDYRSEPFLNMGTKFWLVTPKASITGIEGLDALFSGNYIGIQPGKGSYRTDFDALLQPPPILIGDDGISVKLITNTLSSLDIGSQVFYRQIPVGKIINYLLIDDQNIQIIAFIDKRYSQLVKKNSRFWNVSGIKIDASLQGIKVSSESLTSILAGGIAFSSNTNAELATNGDKFSLYQNAEQATDGIYFSLLSNNAQGLSKGTGIYYRDIKIGELENSKLAKAGVISQARLYLEHKDLLSGTSQFYLQGASISLDGIKHPERILTGPKIELIPGTGQAKQEYQLAQKLPQSTTTNSLILNGVSEENLGAKIGANILYKEFTIGKITDIKLSKNFSQIQYKIEIHPEYISLLTKDSYLFGNSPIDIRASMDGINVKAGNLNEFLNGSLTLVRGNSANTIEPPKTIPIFKNHHDAIEHLASKQQFMVKLKANSQANLNINSPVYYKSMLIGQVKYINWNAKNDDFDIKLAINNEFKRLISAKTVFWQNSAVNFSADLSGVKMQVAPLKTALNGGISIGLVTQVNKVDAMRRLYENQELAMNMAQPISIQFPISSQLAKNAAIRYQNYQIGKIESVELDKDLQHLTAKAYLYGQYASTFKARDSQYAIVKPQISLSGITAPEALITGPFVTAFPGKSKSKSQNFTGLLNSSVYADNSKNDLRLTLRHSKLGSIKVGTPILFRGIEIGEVKGYKLNDSGKNVMVYIAINSDSRHLINQTSKFWDYSGIDVDLSIFTGAQINMDSIESILTGGIAVATEVKTNTNNKVKNGTAMQLHHKPSKKWLSWYSNLAPTESTTAGSTK